MGLSAAEAALGCGVLAALSLTPGCNLVNPPKLAPPIPVVPTPKPDLFDPKDGVTALSPLNDNDPAGLLPDKFRVVNIYSGELLQLQALTGTPGKYLGGSADVYRLAGVLAPAVGQPGYAETVRFIAERTLGEGNEVDVEQDPRFPQDLDARRMVQVYYTPSSGPYKGQKLLLNRMLVRQGFAVVDINAPTSINVRAWLNDEEFARKKRLGLNALGITIGQRIPLDTPSGVIRTPGQRVAPPRRPGERPGARPVERPNSRTTTTTTTTTSTSTTSLPPGAPGAAPGASPGASSGPGGAPGGPPPGAGRPPGAAGGPPPGGRGGPPPGGRGGPPPGGRGGPPPGAGGPPPGSRPGGAPGGAPGGSG